MALCGVEFDVVWVLEPLKECMRNVKNAGVKFLN